MRPLDGILRVVDAGQTQTGGVDAVSSGNRSFCPREASTASWHPGGQ